MATHFRERHGDNVTENQIDLILDACEAPLTKFDASACPLCSEWVPPLEEAINLREFRRHLARHLQQISLEALPLYIEGLVIQETLDQEDAVEYKKGIVLLDSRRSNDNTGLSFAKGDEVIILDNMFDEHMWQVRVIRTGQEGLIPGEGVNITGTTSIPLGDSSAYFWLSWSRVRRPADPGVEYDPSKLRIWTNRSGFSSIQAQFLGMKGDNVHLLKLGGIKIRVPREKLSFQDLAYVEDIIETEFDFEDNTDSDSIQADKTRPDAGTPLARAVDYGITDDKQWVTIHALLEDGQTWELKRNYEDFHKLHEALLAEFPYEAESLSLAFSVDLTDGPMIRNFLPDSKEYLKDLLENPTHISNCALVKRFLTPRDFDHEIDPVDWSKPDTDGLYDHRAFGDLN